MVSTVPIPKPIDVVPPSTENDGIGGTSLYEPS
jgi:hypothetical protein